MGAFPSVSVQYSFPKSDRHFTKEQLYDQLKYAAGSLPHWHLQTYNDLTSDFEAIYKTPCGWIDKIDVAVEETDDDIYIVATSQSTNLCPGWMPFRFLCGACGCFSDHGQNSLHLKELIFSLDVEGKYSKSVLYTTGRTQNSELLDDRKGSSASYNTFNQRDSAYAVEETF